MDEFFAFFFPEKNETLGEKGESMRERERKRERYVNGKE